MSLVYNSAYCRHIVFLLHLHLSISMVNNKTTLTAVEFVYSHDPTEAMRYFLVFWNVLNLLLSLSGNTLVLVSSIKYHAINLDRVSVILIRHLAVADMIYLVPRSIMSVPGLVLKRWVMGSFMCALTTVNTYIASIVSLLLICALNLNKTMAFKFPLKSRLKSKKDGHVIAVCAWVFAVISTVFCGVLTKWTVTFRRNLMHCLEMAEFHSIKELVFALYMILPVVSIVLTTLWLLRFVQKARGLNAQGSMTLVFISIVFIVSWAPGSVYNCIMSFSSDHFKRINAEFLACFNTVAVYVTYINFSFNPLVYYLSISSFNKFVTRIISKGEIAHQNSNT